MPETREDAEHLDVALHADEIEPAQELVLTVADVRAEIAEHAPVAAHPALDALARPADVAVLEQRHEVVADGPAQRVLEIDDAGPALAFRQHHEIARVEVAMDEHLRLEQRLVDQALEGHGQQRALFGRELEPEML